MAGCTCERQERETFKHQLFLCLLWLLNYGTKMTLIVSINVFYPFMCLDVVKKAWKALHPMSRTKSKYQPTAISLQSWQPKRVTVWPPACGIAIFFKRTENDALSLMTLRHDCVIAKTESGGYNFQLAHAPSPFSVICFATHQNSLTSSWILFKSILNSQPHTPYGRSPPFN